MRRRILPSLVFCLLLFCALALPVCAEEPESAVDRFLDQLPSAVKDSLTDAEDGVSEELYGVKFYVSYCITALKDGGRELFKVFFRLVGVILLYAVAERLTGRARDAVTLVFRLTLSLFFLETAEGCLSMTLGTLIDVRKLAEGMTAVFLPLFLAGGNAAAATASGGGFSLFLLVLSFLSDRLLSPLVRAFLAFTLVGGMGGVDLSGFAATLKKTYLWCVGLFSLLFGFLLGTQTLFSSAADSLSLRSMKFAIGNMIPVVGGTVSGALGTLLSSVGYLRSLVGGAATASLFVILLPPLLHLYLLRLSFSLAGDVSTVVGSGSARRLLSDFVSVFDILLATLALSCLSLLFLVTAFLKCAVIAL